MSDNINSKMKKLEIPITSNTEGAVLGKLWRNILVELNLKNNLPYLIDRYISTIRKSKNEKRVARTPLVNNAVAEEMTWKVFLSNIFNLLRVDSIDITITLNHANGSSTPFTIRCNKNKEEEGSHE